MHLRAMHGTDVRVTEDAVAPMLDYFTRRAKKEGITLPADLAQALGAQDVRRYVDTIGPGL
jgi:hypothetical protein